ncbi:hypothetical protein P152DRAFT_130294 [Eremomyces bilateralis CBS 781.70]|uniref:Uncharacterized protein n=1 Tax=Eremomyces bilateralis CBS 781.70 TaxID=1392243 RepID=A0A6G1GF46_9PEZI|nr:uncharacterized protein P152DRAFT_130294 [Eremomyces bilateralis CBS 781.70]KAF1816622.1 hypothetical protein P152DRAFT_130294 [Eremomyces bilateralis CBS 781.70]
MPDTSHFSATMFDLTAVEPMDPPPPPYSATDSQPIEAPELTRKLEEVCGQQKHELRRWERAQRQQDLALMSSLERVPRHQEQEVATRSEGVDTQQEQEGGKGSSLKRAWRWCTRARRGRGWMYSNSKPDGRPKSKKMPSAK